MDDYDSIFAGIIAKRKQNAQAGIAGVAGINPDEAAKAVTTAPKLGVHPEAILPDPGAAAGMAQEESSRAILTGNPAITRWASGSPAKVAATQDDFHNLSLMQKAYSAINEFGHQAVTGEALGQRLQETGGEYAGSFENAWGQLKSDYLSSIPQAGQFDNHSFWENAKTSAHQQLMAGKSIVDAFNLALTPLTGAIGALTSNIDKDVHLSIPQTTPGMLKQALDQSMVGITHKGGLPLIAPELAAETPNAFSGAYAAASGPPRLLSPEAAAAADAQKLKAAEDAIAASKTQARSPDLTKEFLVQQGEKSVFVPPEELLRMEMENPDSVKPLAEGVEGYQDKLVTAMANGTDVEIPANEYLASVSGQPVADELRDFARTGDMSIVEAKTVKDLAAAHELDMATNDRLAADAVAAKLPPTDPEQIAMAKAADEAQTAEEFKTESPEETARVTEVKAQLKQAALDAKNAMYLRQLFPDAKSANMTEPQFSAYAKAVQNATTSSYDKMVSLVQRQLTRERGATWKDTTKTMRAAVEGDLYNRPNIRARSLILYGELPNGEKAATGPIRLDRKVAEATYPKNLIDRLPKGTFGASGVGADDVAEFLGFNSGEELLKSLANLEEARKTSGASGSKQHLEQVVRQMTQDKVRAKLGDLLSPENIIAEARKQVNEPEAFGFLHDELKALAAQAQLSPLSKEAIAAKAEQNFAKLTVKEALTGVREFGRASWKNGQVAETAVLKGKFAEAFKAKQNQIMNQYLLAEANAFIKDFGKAIAQFRRWAGDATIKGMDQEYLNYIHEALGEIGFQVARDPQELQNNIGGESRSQFIARKISEGFNIIEAPIFSAAAKDMRVSEFKGIEEMLRSLAHNGKMVQEIKVGIEKMQFDDAIAEGEAQFESLGKRFTRDQMDFDSLRKKAGHLGRGVDASFLRMETIADLLDSFDPNGIFNRVAIRPTQEAKHLVDDLEEGVKKSLAEFAKTVPKDFGKDFDTRVDIPFKRGGIPGNKDSADADEPIFTKKSQVVAFALNLGNAGNEMKALEGYGLDYLMRDDVLKYMKKEDWDFVQKLWDEFEKLWPRIETLYRNLTGVAPPKIEPVTVRTPFGNYRGGYFPVMYDPFMKPETGARSAGSVYDPSHFSALPPNPYTKGRTNYIAPVHLNLDVFSERIGQIINDIAYREALLNAQKFLLHPKILRGISQTFGPEYADQMRPWLEHLANQRVFDEMGTEVISNMMNRTRMGATMVGLGYRFSTVMMHGPTALALSMSEVGFGPFVKAGWDIYKTPWQAARMYKQLQAESGELRHRVLNMDVNVREQYKKLYEKQGFITLAQHYAFHMVAASDMFSAVPTYLAAKRLAIQDNPGISDADAIALADKRLRLAHGASAPPDIPAILRDPKWRWYSMFMSFMNTMYNRDRISTRMGKLGGEKASEGDYTGAGRDFAHVLARLFYGVVVTAYIHDLVKGTGKEKKGWLQGFSEAIVDRFAAPIPIIRDIANAATTGYDYEAAPLSSVGKEILQSGKDVLHATEGQRVSARWIQHAMETVGYLMVLPIGQAGTTTQYIHDFATGRERPKGFGEFLHGLAFGRSK